MVIRLPSIGLSEDRVPQTLIETGYKEPKLCSGDCWHYSVFGGVEGCGQREEETGNPWPEPIEPGQKCLYPNRREIYQSFIMSSMGFCAALEGAVIKGGSDDNTKLVKILTSAESR